MIKVTYCKHGSPYPDWMCEGLLRMHENWDGKVSTENMVNAIRVLVREKVKKLEEVEIWFEGDDKIPFKLDLDIDGRIRYWPPGFSDTMDKFLERLIK